MARGGAVVHGTELIWLACALAFLGSFGLGWTIEEILRGKRNANIGDDEL